RPRADEASDRLLHVGQGHSAHRALLLRDDDVGRQPIEHIGVDAVHRQALLKDGLHALVDLVARAVDLKLRLGTRWQLVYRRWEIALVRTADEVFLEAERTHDLGRAGDERDDAHSPNTSRRHTIRT